MKKNLYTFLIVCCCIQFPKVSFSQDEKKKSEDVITIIGDGAFKGAFENEDKLNSFGTGSIGAVIENKDTYKLMNILLSFGLETTVKGDLSNYTSSIMVPSVGQASLFFSYRKYRFAKATDIGIYFESNLTKGNWATNDTINPIVKSYLTVAPRFVGTLKIANNLSADKDNEVFISFDLGATGRFLFGNAINDSSFLAQTIQTQKTSFVGVDFGFTIIINGVTGFFSVPFLYAGSEKIDGITGGQVLVGLKIRTDFIKTK